MPYARRYRSRRATRTRRVPRPRYSARKRYTRKYSSKRSVIPPAMFPKMRFAKLKFHDTLTFAGNAVANANWRANGPYDPDYGIGGGSCSGWSLYASQYSSYTCVASKCVVKVNSTFSDHPLAVALIARANNDNAPSSVVEVRSLQEIPNNRVRYKVSEIFRNGANCRPVFLKMYHRTKDVVPYAQYDRTAISATTAATPSAEWFWNFYGIQGGPSVDDALQPTFTADVTITYYVKFSGPKYIADLQN